MDHPGISSTITGVAMDTSGSVERLRKVQRHTANGWSDHYIGVGHVTWENLSPFAQGYVEAVCREWNATFRYLAPETLATMLRDCEEFSANFTGNGKLAASGRQFWNDRQHGRLRTRPPVALYIADDGLFHQREA